MENPIKMDDLRVPNIFGNIHIAITGFLFLSVGETRVKVKGYAFAGGSWRPLRPEFRMLVGFFNGNWSHGWVFVFLKLPGNFIFGVVLFLFGMLKQMFFFRFFWKVVRCFRVFLGGNSCFTYWLPPHSLQNGSGRSYLKICKMSREEKSSSNII